MRTWFAVAALAVLLVASTVHPSPARAVAEGPDPGFTGGFGEPTCASCHFDSPAEPEEGELVLAGVPERYEPGEEYVIEVTLRDPGLERGGFQLAARFAEGEREGRQAGLLRVEGDHAEVVEHGDPPVLYARQTRRGARPVPSHEVTWKVRWTAPAEAGGTGGAVAFHAAANAANHDESAFGDVVHAASARSGPRQP